jgi:hypothetical protein
MLPPKFKKCIELCHQCASTCEACINICLGEKDVNPLATIIARCRDLAGIAALAERLMVSRSRYAYELCAVCAEVARACADKCMTHSEITACRKCADACYECADECRDIALQKKNLVFATTPHREFATR